MIKSFIDTLFFIIKLELNLFFLLLNYFFLKVLIIYTITQLIKNSWLNTKILLVIFLICNLCFSFFIYIFLFFFIPLYLAYYYVLLTNL